MSAAGAIADDSGSASVECGKPAFDHPDSCCPRRLFDRNGSVTVTVTETIVVTVTVTSDIPTPNSDVQGMAAIPRELATAACDPSLTF